METPRFELLEILVAAAESKNLYEAAGLVKLSQPAVSMKLKELEEQTPLPVFSIEGRRKVLTHYGRSLYEIAKNQVVRLAREYEELNRLYAEAKNLTLKVGCRRAVFECVAHKLKFDGRMEFVDLSGHNSVLKLLDRSIDIAISYERPDSAEIIGKKLFDSGCNFNVHKRWLHKKKLDLELVRSYDFLRSAPSLLYQAGGHLLRDWLEHIKMDFSNLQVAFVADDWQVIQRMVDHGAGYAIVPSYVIPQSLEVETIEIPASVLPKYHYYALFRKDLKRIQAFRKLLEFA
jgi:DNA-binding transcriptional LysR family regulator